MEKVKWNSIEKKQNGLKYSKNDKSSTLPRNNMLTLNLTARIKHLECEFGATYKYKGDYSKYIDRFNFVSQAIVHF